jgi:hypothetical protein
MKTYEKKKPLKLQIVCFQIPQKPGRDICLGIVLERRE